MPVRTQLYISSRLQEVCSSQTKRPPDKVAINSANVSYQLLYSVVYDTTWARAENGRNLRAGSMALRHDPPDGDFLGSSR